MIAGPSRCSEFISTDAAQISAAQFNPAKMLLHWWATSGFWLWKQRVLLFGWKICCNSSEFPFNCGCFGLDLISQGALGFSEVDSTPSWQGVPHSSERWRAKPRDPPWCRLQARVDNMDSWMVGWFIGCLAFLACLLFNGCLLVG